MRKFFGIVIISITFFACLFTAIFLAENISPAPNTLANSRLVTSNQYHLLILVVDEMDSTTPDLISAVSVIFYTGDQQGIIFIPLVYKNSDQYDLVREQIRIDKAKRITSTTVNFFQKTYEMKWDGTILLDRKGLSDLWAWITSLPAADNPMDLPGSFTSMDSLQNLLQTTCNTITTNQLASLETFQLESLIPDHFSSPIALENLQAIWLQFDAEMTMQCEWHFLP